MLAFRPQGLKAPQTQCYVLVNAIVKQSGLWVSLPKLGT